MGTALIMLIFVLIYVVLFMRQLNARAESQALLEELQIAHAQLAEYAQQVESLTLEAERQRQAQLRARHQASLDKQYQQLAAAPNYDRVRFYTTLMLDGERVKNSRIDLV